MKKMFSIILIAALVLSLFGCGSQGQAASGTSGAETAKSDVIRIGAIPDQDSSKLNPAMEAVAKYLSEKTGRKVEFVPTVDYAALVTAFERGDMQLAWFGGLTGVQARSVSPGSEAILQRPKDAKFKSVFIAQKSLGLKALSDIKGKTFTFGSESSTSGALMPRYFMTQAGINPEKDLKGAPNYSGNHDKTIKLVESGAYQTGALNISVWEKAVANKTVDTGKVDVFYTTPEYFDYNWTIADVDKTFGAGTKESVKKALMELNKAQNPDIMNFFQTDSFVETNNGNYAAIEEVAKSLGIIK